MQQYNLKDTVVVNIDWDFANADEQCAAFDVDGELVFSVLPLVDISCGEWVDTNDELARKTNVFPLGKYDAEEFPNWDETVYFRDHIRYKDEVYAIHKPICNLGAELKSNSIELFSNDTIEVKIDRLVAMKKSIEIAIDILKSEIPKTQPDWSKAPAWANWWAVDSEDGDAWYFEEEPVLEADFIEDPTDTTLSKTCIYWYPLHLFTCRFDVDTSDKYPFYDAHNFHLSLTKRPE